MTNYEKNLAIIKACNQQMAETIDNAKVPEYIKFTKSRNKQDNFLYCRGSIQYAAYDMTNPTKTIKALLKDQKFEKDNGSILIGAGMGHYIYEFCKNKEKGHHLVVLEPESYFIKKSFENYDYTKWFNDGTLIFVGKDVDLSFAIYAIDTAVVIQGWNVICSNYAYNRPQEYADLIEYANGIINQMNCNIGTVMGAGPQIAENDILNLPYIIRHRGVNELKDLYKGCPAVIVSTGPSLEKNIFHLQKMGSRVIIIAVAQALRVLMAYDIKPDFICTVDYGKVNEDHFKGLYDSNVPLVALNRTYAPILKKWKGAKFIVSGQAENDNSKDTVSGIINQKGCLVQGGSVSHMAFGLALHMGCDPIILIGQDLSYPDDKSHIPLADASGTIEEKDGNLKWNIKDGRSSLGKKQYSMSDIIKVYGYYGEPVRTNRGLASFITTYERIIKEVGIERKIINATEGGAKIHGTEQYTLKDAVDRFARFNINKKRINNYLGLINNPDESIKEVIPLLEKDIELMIEVAGNAKKGLKTVKDIREANKKKSTRGKIEGLLLENKKYSKEAEQRAGKLPLLGLSIYYESRLIHNKQLKVKGKLKHILKNKDDLEIRLKRNEIILLAAKNACTRLIKLYKQTSKVLKDHLEGKDVLTSKEEYIPNISDAEEMFKAGNWGRPLLEARMIKEKKIPEMTRMITDSITESDIVIRKALEMRKQSIERNTVENEDNKKLIQYYRYIEQGRKKGQKGEFTDALLMLKQAVELYPNKEHARWGLATALNHCKEYSKSLKEYEKLMKLNPEYLRYKFEYGQVMLNKDVQKGMQIIGEVMKETQEFDAFLVRIGDMYFEKGMAEQAIIAYEHYLDKFPPEVIMLTNLLKCYKMIGKDKLARKTLQKYRSWFPR